MGIVNRRAVEKRPLEADFGFEIDSWMCQFYPFAKRPHVGQLRFPRLSVLDSGLLMEIFHRLFARFGPQNWWPGDSRLEVIVGAVLTQNTVWTNVEKAIRALKDSGSLSIELLHEIPEEALAEKIRPCGYFRIKASRLKNLVRMIIETFGGDLDALFSLPVDQLRQTLLSVSGIGPETADSIILYAARKPIFVVDTYTRRALTRHRWIENRASYEEIQSLFMEQLPLDERLFNEYHALWVAVGKTHCRAKARCEGCPLQELLP